VLGASLLAPTGLANAAGETCRGEAATIVGTGALVLGTEGRDVIVSGVASTVESYGGDDLVCLAGTASSSIRADAGTGDDLVDTTATTVDRVDVSLGPGADTFYGGPADDVVHASSDPVALTPDIERDVVVTGAGDDHVTTGQHGAPNDDLLDLGDGDDVAAWYGATPSDPANVAGGGGRDQLRLRLLPGDWLVRNPSGLAERDGAAVVRWTAVERFRFDRTEQNAGRVDYFGTHAGDEVEVHADRPELVPGALRVGFGSGDDTLTISGTTGPGSLWAGGPGSNRLVFATAAPSLWLDMAAYRLDLGSTRGTTAEVDVYRFDDVHLMARRIWVKGTTDDDTIHTTACRQRVNGDAGNDTIAAVADDQFDTYVFGCRGRARFRGDKGKDSLRGSPGPDRLDGGGGRDRATGRAGRDRCVAEVRRSCER
jgi:Ca2+-binding RTX toxin-like protein